MIEQMVPAKELINAINHGIDSSGESVSRLLKWKLHDCDPSFMRSIKRYGVKMPILVQVARVNQHRPRWVLGNGHHRLAVAAHFDQDIPVIFITPQEARCDYDLADLCYYKGTSSSQYINSSGHKETEW